MNKLDIDKVFKGILAVTTKVPDHVDTLLHDMEIRGRAYQYKAEHVETAEGEEISNEDAIMSIIESGCDGYPLHGHRNHPWKDSTVIGSCGRCPREFRQA